MKKLHVVYFSPTGGTEKVARAIAEEFPCTKVYHDILERRIEKKASVASDEVLLVVMPVFSGRVPKYCISSIKRLSGNGSPAIIAAVYGNCEYEDTLVEMQDELEAEKFNVIAAGAFIAQHSLVETVATGRPDEQDMTVIKEFAAKCVEKAAGFKPEDFTRLELPGNRPYRPYDTRVIAPKGTRVCTKCHACVKICPADAISGATPRKTDKTKCIMCGACVAHCHVHARHFKSMKFSALERKISSEASKRKEPEIFLGE